MTQVAVLNYGMGNLRSVEKALEHLGAGAVLTADLDEAGAADAVILPGVGAFPRAMARIRELGMDAFLREWSAANRPLLGVCLGMQLLFEHSTELGGSDGLGLLEGTVTELDAAGLKVPHMGWEAVRWERDSTLAGETPSETPFYFVHSFAPRPAQEADVAGTAEWGERFACAVERGPLWGVQFHPEKSSEAGLGLLDRFIRACVPGPV